METNIKVTLSDIAQKLNFSIVTVSKALRDHPDISTKTKERIKRTAVELGYTPNYLARSLAAKRSHTIGLVVPQISNYFYPAIIKSIYDATFKIKYDVLLTVSYEDAEREKLHLESLMSKRVDGLLVSISETTTDSSLFRKIKKLGFPLVFFDRTVDDTDFSSVKIDDRKAAFKAVEHAIEKGYKKIAHFAGSSNIDIGRQRLEGFLTAMESYNIPVNDDWIIECGFSKQYGYNAFLKIFKTGLLPEIIFTVGFSVALGVYTAATEVGIRIPEDIDLIFIGDGQINPFASRSLSCVSSPVKELGEESVKLLMNHIDNPESAEIQQVILEAELINY
ncbi:hypothetical protein BVY01_02285 [bacterium I07]|nr:hypothetical protein BVY01_02285 [bacterium I07]